VVVSGMKAGGLGLVGAAEPDVGVTWDDGAVNGEVVVIHPRVCGVSIVCGVGWQAAEDDELDCGRDGEVVGCGGVGVRAGVKSRGVVNECL